MPEQSIGKSEVDEQRISRATGRICKTVLELSLHSTEPKVLWTLEVGKSILVLKVPWIRRGTISSKITWHALAMKMK